MSAVAAGGRRRRSIVIAILGLALASAIAWFASADREAGVPSKPTGAIANETVAPAVATPPATAAPSETAVRAPAPDASRSGDDGASAPIVHGRVVVVGRDRVERADADGELVVGLPKEKPLAPMPIRGGRFDWTAPLARSFELRRVAIDGHATVAEQPRLEVVPGTEPVVRVREVGPTTLRVFDAESGRELQDVSVLNRWRDQPDPDACSAADQVVLHRPSPLELRPSVSERGTFAFNCWYLLVAPDHEATRIDLDLALGGEFTYHLGAAASVEVTLRGWSAPPSLPDGSAGDAATQPLVAPPPLPLIRLRQRTPWDIEARVRDELAADAAQSPADARAKVLEQCGHELVGWMVKCEERPDRKPPIRIHGLKPGSWTVSAELGDENDRRPPLAWAQVELAAGATTPVVLDLPELSKNPAPAPLRGLVEVPEEWHSESWSLELRSAERDRSARRLKIERAAMTAEAGRPGFFRFAVDAVTPGTYVARVIGFEVQRLFVQTASPGADVEIHVPPPVEAELILRDRRSRESIDVGPIALTPENSARFSEWHDTSVDFDPARHLYPLRVPAGSYELGFEDGRYHEPPGSIAVDGQSKRIECDLDAACGVLVRMVEGEVPRSSREVVQCVGISPKDRNQVGRRFYYEPDRLRIVVAGPGTYELDVHVPDGFRPIDARELVLREGEFVPLEFRLERK